LCRSRHDESPTRATAHRGCLVATAVFVTGCTSSTADGPTGSSASTSTGPIPVDGRLVRRFESGAVLHGHDTSCCRAEWSILVSGVPRPCRSRGLRPCSNRASMGSLLGSHRQLVNCPRCRACLRRVECRRRTHCHPGAQPGEDPGGQWSGGVRQVRFPSLLSAIRRWKVNRSDAGLH